MKRILIALTALLLSVPAAFAQQDPKAKQVLDAVSGHYRNLDSFRANYKQTYEGADGEVYDELSGQITVKGDRFRIDMGDYLIITDGKTLWNYMKNSNEVNISNYEPGEGEITPTEIYTLYEKDYKYALMSELKDEGRTYQVIDLEPEDRRSEIAKIRLTVDKDNHNIRRWVIFERGTNSRQVFEIEGFEPGVTAPSSMFNFDQRAHKDVKVVDLRY